MKYLSYCSTPICFHLQELFVESGFDGLEKKWKMIMKRSDKFCGR
jgi:hypothetical protein